MVLGHGAGGGVEAPDLVAATEVANEEGFSVALVEQPYKVAGKRSQPAAAKLDEAWITVVQDLKGGPLEGLPLIAGGRSAGARVACRTVAETGAAAVLCLAFPVHPPGKPEKSRLDELESVEVPVLVVQGTSDPFGMPRPRRPRTRERRTSAARHRVSGGAAVVSQIEVAEVPGNHSLKKDLGAVRAAVSDWLPRALAQRT